MTKLFSQYDPTAKEGLDDERRINALVRAEVDAILRECRAGRYAEVDHTRGKRS